jgi:hypothetical protein
MQIFRRHKGRSFHIENVDASKFYSQVDIGHILKEQVNILFSVFILRITISL